MYGFVLSFLPQKINRLAQHVRLHKPEYSYIDGCCYDDFGNEQYVDIGDGNGDDVGGKHRGDGEQQKWQNVDERLEETETDVAPYEPVPYEQPQDVDAHVDENHQFDALETEERPVETRDAQEVDYHEKADDDGVPHVDARLATADDVFRIEACDGEKGSANAEKSEQRNGIGPLVAHDSSHNLRCYEGKAKHGWEGYERGEAKHLAEGPAKALGIVAHLHEHRLGNVLHHSSDRLTAHQVPLVGIGVETYLTLTERTCKEGLEGILVDILEYVGDENLATEAEHLLDWLNAELKRRTPMGVGPTEDGHHADVDDGLTGNSPIFHAAESHHDAENVGCEKGCNRDVGKFLGLHLLHQFCPWNDGKTGTEESEERVAGKPDEAVVVVVVGYEWCTHPKDDVDADAYDDIEPKDGTEIPLCGILPVDEGRDETALLNVLGNGRIDAEHTDHSIVLRVENPQKYHAKHCIEYLHEATVHRSPEQALGRFLFQTFLSHSVWLVGLFVLVSDIDCHSVEDNSIAIQSAKFLILIAGGIENPSEVVEVVGYAAMSA